MAYDFSRCPRCSSKTIKSKSWNGTDSEFWRECTRCNTYINTYIPQEHQYDLHSDPHRYMGNFGGYGTGKTTTSREELLKHLIITDNANALAGANVSAQYEQTIKRELENDIPRAFVKDYSVKHQYMDLHNGARLMWRSFDDPGKLRSLNLSMFVIVEGSETTLETLSQLKTRLRNRVATTIKKDKYGKTIYADKEGTVPAIDKDWRKGIIESNPDSGYIRTDILLPSEEINMYGGIDDYYQQDPERVDVNISSYVAATNSNKYLPDNFEEELKKNKPDWWIKRFLKGSFQFSEGLVYPSAMAHIVEPFEIPKNWKRLIAFDYGLADPARFVYVAIDDRTGIAYAYRNDHTDNKNVKELAQLYRKGSADIPEGGLYTSPLIDPKSGFKRDFNKNTLANLMLEEGIYFQPGAVNVDARVIRMNTYLEAGKLKIFSSCNYLVEELKEYKFKERTLDAITDKQANKPIDKNNHSINGLEWIVMALPADPNNVLMGVYNSRGDYLRNVVEAKDTPLIPWQFEQDSQGPAYVVDEFEVPSFDLFEY